MKPGTLALTLLSAVTFVPAAYATAPTELGTHPQTTDPSMLVDIHVKITDAQITLDRHTVPRGAAARFFVRNVGTLAHGFILRGNGLVLYPIKVKPRTQKILLIYFDYRGALWYRSSFRYDWSKPGMKGKFRVV